MALHSEAMPFPGHQALKFKALLQRDMATEERPSRVWRIDIHWVPCAGTSPTRKGLLSGLSMDADPLRPPLAPGIQQVGLLSGASLCRPRPLLACATSAHSPLAMQACLSWRSDGHALLQNSKRVKILTGAYP